MKYTIYLFIFLSLGLNSCYSEEPKIGNSDNSNNIHSKTQEPNQFLGIKLGMNSEQGFESMLKLKDYIDFRTVGGGLLPKNLLIDVLNTGDYPDLYLQEIGFTIEYKWLKKIMSLAYQNDTLVGIGGMIYPDTSLPPEVSNKKLIKFLTDIYGKPDESGNENENLTDFLWIGTGTNNRCVLLVNAQYTNSYYDFQFKQLKEPVTEKMIKEFKKTGRI